LKQCAQCHEHRLPNTISLPAWHGKIDKMSNLAGLSKAEEEDLQAYLGEFSDR
jgi:cytochrome c553